MAHIIGDALGSIGVIVSILLIKYGEPYLGHWRFLADPLCSLVIVALLLHTTIPVIRESVDILLIKVPPTINVAEMKKKIYAVPGVLDVHCLHIWTMNDTTALGYMHLVVSERTDAARASRRVKTVLHKHGVHATTIQVERASPEQSIKSMRSSCTDLEACRDPGCQKKKCCNLDITIEEALEMTNHGNLGI